MRTTTYLMNKKSGLFNLVIGLLIAFSGNLTAQQNVITSVFLDDFNNMTDASIPINTREDSPTTYSVTRDRLEGDLPSTPYLTTGGLLRVANKKGDGHSGRLYVSGALDAYTNPFTSKLNEIDADSLMWTFNMRNNSSVSYLGFDDNQRACAVVLAATGSDFSTASGYAMAYYGTSNTDNDANPEGAIVRSWRIVKFTDGLYQNENIEVLIERNSNMTTSVTGYYSIQVVYIPSTNTWKLYTRLDSGSGTFKHPIDDAANYTFVGSGSDATYTDVDMTHFGFFLNYIGVGDYIQFYDNFEVRTFKYDIGTNLRTTASQKFYQINKSGNTIQIEAEKATAILYDAKGSLVRSMQISGANQFEALHSGLYILRVVSAEGQLFAEKLIVQ